MVVDGEMIQIAPADEESIQKLLSDNKINLGKGPAG
jgi:hypothetical protein